MKLAVAPLVAVALMAVITVASSRALDTQSKSMGRVLEQSTEGNALLADSADGIQAVNGAL